jgi:hypothetical protein
MAGLEPPELLIDRSLGGIAVPEYLKSVWPSEVRTIDDQFGTRKVEDTEWMSLADEQGWIAVCKDGRIRRRRGERELMSRGSLRVFCLANGNLRREVMVERFKRNLGAMLAQSSAPGPWLYALYSDKISPVWAAGMTIPAVGRRSLRSLAPRRPLKRPHSLPGSASRNVTCHPVSVETQRPPDRRGDVRRTLLPNNARRPSLSAGRGRRSSP